MTRIEEVKQLRKEWQARELRAEYKGNEKLAAEAHNIAYGLTLAIGIFKEPSNTQLKIDGLKCTCAKGEKESSWYCQEHGFEYKPPTT